MRNRIRLKPRHEEHIEEMSKRALQEATCTQETIEFTFNGVLVIVTSNDTHASVLDRYSRSIYKRKKGGKLE